MKETDLLEKTRLDKFYQVGTVASFLIFMASIILDIKIVTNEIIAFFSLSSFFFFMGTWMNTSPAIKYSSGNAIQVDEFKPQIFGKVSYVISLIFLILALVSTYRFYT